MLPQIHLRSFGDNALGYTFGFEDLGSNIGTSDQDFDDIEKLEFFENEKIEQSVSIEFNAVDSFCY